MNSQNLDSGTNAQGPDSQPDLRAGQPPSEEPHGHEPHHQQHRGNRTAGKGQPLRIRSAMPAPLLLRIILVSAVTLGASTAIAWDAKVPAWEVAVLRFVNDWPDWLEPFMWFLQQVGVIGAPAIAAVVVVWFTRRWQHAIPFVLVLPLKFLFEKRVIKRLVERERPFVSVGSEINVRGPALEGLSFPSGHTTTAFATAILVMAFLPQRWRPLPPLWAATVAIARMYYGEHNLLDVVAGAAMGTIFATTLWFFFLNTEVNVSNSKKTS